ncbi:MAG: ABC transporter ATP-binding protein [Dehalococcoidia bacterium]|nr:ABC transporter ATP-binding protein [Dehalococcoidia bacterium]
MTEPVISVRGLSVRYRTREKPVHALDDVSFDLTPGRVLALVGESGSGKSTAAMSITRLLPNEAEVLGGTVMFDGVDLLGLDDHQLRSIRGRRISMIFQDPVAGLNPVIPIGDQVAEALTSHLAMHKKDAKKQAIAIMREVGLSDPERVAKAYPFQLSGGMCQRVMIGIATALNPEVIIADEPTSALDVTVQAQILHQLDVLRRQRGTAILLITHDFGVVAQLADEVAVMYAGRVIERGTTDEMMGRPLHPYTHALLATLPRLDGSGGPLHAIPGHPPEMNAAAEHCPFIPRCTKVMNVCRADPAPPLMRRDGGNDHPVACYNPIWQAEPADA